MSNNNHESAHERDHVASLSKGLAIIEMFNENRRTATINEAAVATGITRAAARRYLLTLVQLGYANYDGKFFSLTPKIMRLGHTYLTLTPYAKLLQYYVDALSKELGEATVGGILAGDEAMVIAYAEPARLVSIALSVGSRLPLHSTAIGRVFLAYGDEDFTDTYVRNVALEPRTAKALRSKADLISTIQMVRELGYSLVDEEVEEGLRSLGVPIYNSSGLIKAVITVAVSASKYTGRRLVSTILPALLKTQAELRSV